MMDDDDFWERPFFKPEDFENFEQESVNSVTYVIIIIIFYQCFSLEIYCGFLQLFQLLYFQRGIQLFWCPFKSRAADCTHIGAHCAAINNLYCNNSNQLRICADIYACVLQLN